MTSRNPDCGFLATTSDHEGLDGLEEPECVQLLRQTAQLSEVASDTEDYAVAVTLVQHLGHHTLAILQAGSYIFSTHCSISEYLDFFRTNRQRLLAKSRGQGQSRYDTVYATFGASMEFLESLETGISEETRRDALQLLEVLSTFHYTSMPLDILMDAWEGAKKAQNTSEELKMHSDKLTAWHVARIPYFISPKTNDVKLRITDAVARLESLALVKADRPGRVWRSVSMHPLVHGWAGDRQSQQQRKDALRMTECIVALSHTVLKSWRPYHHQLTPHLKRLVELDVDLVNDAAQCICVLQICVHIAWLYHQIDLNRDMYKLTSRIFQRLGLDDQNPTVELRGLYRVFAVAVEEGSRPAQAIRTFQAIERLDKRTLGNKYTLGRLGNMRELGIAYNTNGRTKDAVALLRVVFKALQGLGAEDGELLKAQHSLALALKYDGQTKEAIMLLEKVVMIRQRLLSEDNGARLASQQLLATAYLQDGQIAEATCQLEDLARIYAQTLGEEHPHTAVTQGSLALAYRKAGRFSEAIALHEQVVNTETLLLGEEHPGLATSQYNLASAYWAAGRIQEAIDILERVVHIDNSTRDETDRRRLRSQHKLARAYLAAERGSEAIGIFERVVAIRKSTLEEKHPDLLEAQQGLGRAYLQAGRIVEAIGTLEQVAKVVSLRYDQDYPARVALQKLLYKAYAIRDGSFPRSGIFPGLSCAPEEPALQRAEASKHDSANDGPTVEAEGQRLETSGDSLEGMLSSSLVLGEDPDGLRTRDEESPVSRQRLHHVDGERSNMAQL